MLSFILRIKRKIDCEHDLCRLGGFIDLSLNAQTTHVVTGLSKPDEARIDEFDRFQSSIDSTSLFRQLLMILMKPAPQAKIVSKSWIRESVEKDSLEDFSKFELSV